MRTTFTFAIALMLLKEGDRLQRANWMSTHIGVQRPDENSRMRHPYLFQNNGGEQSVPWVPTQIDLFAEDWQIYETRDGHARREVPSLG